jgi:signal transduction histidine kinase/DNA-binding response OmpR family regulator
MGNDQFERIEYGKNSNLELRSVHDFLEDENGNIWFGGNGDLIKLDSVLNGQYYFSEHEIFPHINGFIKPSITSLDQDISGNILVGTRGFGLVIYNPNSKKVKTLSKKDGLPSNDIAGITISRDNSTWISTGNGLLNINTKDLFFKDTLIVHTYDVKDGLQGNTFITGAILCTKDGMIYVGGNNGFNAFNPNLLIKNKQTSPVYITQLKINHQSVHKESKILNNNSIQAINEIKLKHNQSTITLNFTAVDFKSSDKIQYQYRLTGFENKWNKSGIERKATYTNLDPGIYKFNVKAANSSGIWNQKPTTLKITILPPWWQTWWAAILYLVIVTISVLLFRRFLIAKERKRNQLALEKMEVSKEKELSKLKLQFFTNISHELRTPLSLIGGPVEQLLTKNNYDREQKIQLNLVRRNTRRLVQLVDQLMDFRKLESQTLPYNPTKDNLIYHIKLIYNDFIYLAESKNIDYTFYSNKNEFHTAFDADKLQKIISNLISNAFKFSKTNGKIGIYVEVDESAKKYCIEVSDNGIGISEQHLKNIFNPFYQAHTEYFNKHKGTGIGLTLCKALVEVHGGKIEVISNKNGISDTGFNTIFRIKIPVRDDLTNINHSMPYDSKSTDYMEDILELSLLEEYLPDQQEKPTVLLVEDNIDVKTFIQLHLSRFYNFITADNGLNGLESAKEHLPDLIVSDVIMPEMDGVEMCHELKQITDTSHIPIIMLTAKTSDESIVDGLKTGIDTYITKPFNINILASYINNILKNRNEIYERYKKSYFVDSYKIYSTETDEKFLEKIHQILKDNLSDFSFGVDRLSREVGMSRTNFYKKIKKLTGLTVNEFIKNYKLKVAASLLIKSELNINEIVYEIGLKDASYFSRCFKETFGCLPSEFYEKYKLNNENVLSPK